MIDIKNLTFAYHRKPRLFNSLDLQLMPGNIYGLLGRNGAGKTSLLRILAGLIFPQSGEMKVMGFEPGRRQQPFLADLFLLAEDHYIPPVRISRLIKMYAPFYPKFDEAYFGRLIQHFKLDIDQNLGRLSYGERKKAMISFGLATHCRLLMLDEPTSGLDIPSKNQFRKLIANAARPERTFIISTHQVLDLNGIIDPVIMLDKGKIILQASLEAIGQKVSFHHQFKKPGPGEALYYQHTPGGYLCLKLGATYNSDSLEIDLEILFNAIINLPEEFRSLFHKKLQHES